MFDLWYVLAHCLLALTTRRISVLETSDTNPEDDQTDSEASQSTMWMRDDRWQGGYNQDDMSNHREGKRNLNRLQPSPELVGNVSTQNRHQVTPECID